MSGDYDAVGRRGGGGDGSSRVYDTVGGGSDGSSGD